MRYRVLATDYDGTLAQNSRVADETLRALERLKRSGMKLVIVSGRQLPHLARDFPAMALFDRVVVENGAVLHTPSDGTGRPLAAPPPARLVEELRARHVEPLAVGEVIVATDETERAAVLEVIAELGLELELELEANKGALMLLPQGVHKGSGLAAALAELGARPDETVGVGDAENDLCFLSECGLAVAVADALPSVQRAVNVVTHAPNGAGVRELIEALLGDDLGRFTVSA